MTEAGSSLSLISLDNNIPPSSASARPDHLAHRSSRPLSEISENEDRRRSSARHSLHSVKGEKERGSSRPNSEVWDDNSTTTKRLSGHIATITLNLNDYASAVKRPPSALSTKSRESLISPSSVAGPSINKVAAKPERPASFRTTSVSSIKEIQRELTEEKQEVSQRPISTELDTKEGHPLLVSKRASLRPSPLGATYADIAKSEPPTPSIPTHPETQASASTVSLVSSSAQSTTDQAKPLPKSKPSWLRRASGTAALSSKSKSPVPLEVDSLPASASLPPVLPPRRGVISTAAGGLLDRASKPPDHPSKNSYASIAAASSRSRLGEGAGRPAISPPLSTLPTRDNLNIRSRIAAWTTVSQQPTLQSSSISRSDSSSTIATTASSALTSAQQRLPSSAQRMIGSAGSAVQKGWAGLRARGMGGSISNLSSIASGSEGRRESLEPPKFTRKGSRDRSVSAQATMGSSTDGPIFHPSAILRQASGYGGQVFGRDITEAGKAWGVFDAGHDVEGMSVWERRRRECLPAVIIRAVDYLEIWGPKEEGIFRISGRTSHINRVRREFDSGADIDMADCHPGDLDPHAVSGIFKSYLRELPSPLLTKNLSPRFEAAVRRSSPSNITSTESDQAPEDLADLLPLLPPAHWFLLADTIRLLDLIPRHSATNRMTLNALMLSLGPSLQIPGGVLAALLERRDELFSAPPSISGTQAAIDLINFGETSVAMATIEDISRSTTPTPKNSLDAALSVPISDKPKRSPLLPNKPSFSRLLSVASSSSSRKDVPAASTPIVQSSPPRVDVTTDSARLPSFDNDTDSTEAVQELKEKDLPPRPSEESGSSDPHYPTGTVEDRAKLFSTLTPIADMYAGNTSPLPSLRNNQSFNGSTSSLPLGSYSTLGPALSGPSAEHSAQSALTNPASVIRRGPPIFFQSAGTDRHGRSTSANSTTTSSGVKRKDDGGADAESDVDGEDGRAKRLSAGPGSLSVRETVRGMELAA